MPNDEQYILEEHPSINFAAREQGGQIKGIIAHYTVADEERSLALLDGSAGVKVSAHYLISDRQIERKPLVYRLVDESKRSGHAGISAFQGHSKLNDMTIGIEIVNLSRDLEIEDLEESAVQLPQVQFIPFSDHQIEAFAALVKDICERRSDISPTWITGHADIAPHRERNWKTDPGPLFPWKQLFEQYGIGAWYDETEVNAMKNQLTAKDHPDISWVQQCLQAYSYPVEITGELDSITRRTLCVFMMHFRPEQYPGRVNEDKCLSLACIDSEWFEKTLHQSLNSEFYAILDSLVRRYVPQATLKNKGIMSLQDYVDTQYRASHSMRP